MQDKWMKISDKYFYHEHLLNCLLYRFIEITNSSGRWGFQIFWEEFNHQMVVIQDTENLLYTFSFQENGEQPMLWIEGGPAVAHFQYFLIVTIKYVKGSNLVMP